MRAITGMAGPVLFTQVFAMAISPRARIHLPGAPYYLAAVLLLGSLLLAAYVTRLGAETIGAQQQSAASFDPSD